MPIRVVSGMITTQSAAYGSAKITFADNEASGNLIHVEQYEQGPPGDFVRPPCGVLGIEEVEISHRHNEDQAIDIKASLKLENVSKDEARIQWDEVKQFTYLFVGEVNPEE